MSGVELKGLKVLNDLGNTLNSYNHNKVSTDHIELLPIDNLFPGKYQPRTVFDNEKLKELAKSINESGIIQPIVARKIDSKQYEIIAGERRWRASKILGLAEVPVIVKNITNEAARILPLIENIQREELNPIDRAMALAKLVDMLSMTHEEISEVIGIPRTTISNLIRLLNLTEEVKEYLKNEKIDIGHAKILLALVPEKQSYFARMVVNNGLSVRKLEELTTKEKGVAKKKPNIEIRDYMEKIAIKLKNKLSRDVFIKLNANGKGKLMISVKSITDLNTIVSLIERVASIEP